MIQNRHVMEVNCCHHHTLPILNSNRNCSLKTRLAAGTTGTATPVPVAHQPPESKSELQSIIDSIPLKRILIWAAVGFCLFQLKEFFGIAMGVFIISFIGNSFVEAMNQSKWFASFNPQARRRFTVIMYFSIIIAVVVFFGVATIPDIAREGAEFVRRLKSDNVWVVLVEKMRAGLGDHIMENIERFIALATSKDLTVAAADHGTNWTAERSTQLGLSVSGMLKGYTTTAANLTARLFTSVTKFALQVGVALILSFMLVWDLPAIAAGVKSLKKSRLKPIYDEVAPGLYVFGHLFGKALEAQARIALLNTALTALGMWALQIPGIGLLSLFVFLCSFIPIAGVIISTTPIGFVALTEYGFFKLALVILMVAGVHFIEAYALNPAIYSASLKLHPLMVLTVLVVAEHSLGVWGLLLAVPATVFALDYCIKYPMSTATEVGAQELRSVLQSRDEGGAQTTPGMMPAKTS